MRMDPRLIVELLQRLEQQNAAQHPYFAQLTASFNRSDFERALEATGSLYGVLESIVATRTRLREHVMSIDGLGEPESILELAIRGRSVVIDIQRGRLRDAFREPNATERARGWFVGSFRNIDDVLDYLGKLQGQPRDWEQYRSTQQHQPGVSISDTERFTLYRTTLRIVQRTMRERGSLPALVHFLQKGIAATDWTEAHIGCRQIAAALNGEVDVEPEINAVSQAPRVRPVPPLTRNNPPPSE